MNDLSLCDGAKSVIMFNLLWFYTFGILVGVLGVLVGVLGVLVGVLSVHCTWYFGLNKIPEVKVLQQSAPCQPFFSYILHQIRCLTSSHPKKIKGEV